MSTVAEAVVEGLQDQRLFDFGDGAADHGLRVVAAGQVGDVGFQIRSVGEADRFWFNFIAGRKQHGAVQGVFKCAHIAWPLRRRR